MFELTVSNKDEDGNGRDLIFYFHSENEAYEALQYIEEHSLYHKVTAHWIEVYPNVKSFIEFFDSVVLKKED